MRDAASVSYTHLDVYKRQNERKLMFVSKNKFTNFTLNINQRPVERARKFTYVGTIVNEQRDHSQEIKSRIERQDQCTLD